MLCDEFRKQLSFGGGAVSIAFTYSHINSITSFSITLKNLQIAQPKEEKDLLTNIVKLSLFSTSMEDKFQCFSIQENYTDKVFAAPNPRKQKVDKKEKPSPDAQAKADAAFNQLMLEESKEAQAKKKKHKKKKRNKQSQAKAPQNPGPSENKHNRHSFLFKPASAQQKSEQLSSSDESTPSFPPRGPNW